MGSTEALGGLRGRITTLAWASSRERRRRSCCLLGPSEAWGAGSSEDAWERTRRSSLRCTYWSWALRSACTASFWGKGRSTVRAPSSPSLAHPHPPGPHHPLLLFHPLLLELLPPLLNLSSFGGQGLAMMGDGEAASGPLVLPFHEARCLSPSGPFSGSAGSQRVFSPRLAHPHSVSQQEDLVVTSSFLP